MQISDNSSSGEAGVLEPHSQACGTRVCFRANITVWNSGSRTKRRQKRKSCFGRALYWKFNYVLYSVL